MNGEHRRRIDQILEEGFLTGLESTDLDELRELRRMTDEVETELSIAQASSDLIASGVFDSALASDKEDGESATKQPSPDTSKTAN